jgi:Rho-binding antiterminator
MSSTPEYVPIACGFHDRLEHHAVRGAAVEVVWTDGGTERAATTRLADVFAADGADWVRLASGDVIRADRLVSVDGTPLPRAC